MALTLLKVAFSALLETLGLLWVSASPVLPTFDNLARKMKNWPVALTLRLASQPLGLAAYWQYVAFLPEVFTAHGRFAAEQNFPEWAPDLQGEYRKSHCRGNCICLAHILLCSTGLWDLRKNPDCSRDRGDLGGASWRLTKGFLEVFIQLQGLWHIHAEEHATQRFCFQSRNGSH